MRSVEPDRIFVVNNLKFWHRALGHTSVSKTKNLVKGIDIKGNKEVDACEVCIKAKLCRKPFLTERHRANKPLEIIHSDICGPIGMESWDGYKYFKPFLDDYTNFIKIYLLKTKDEAFSKIINYINLCENHFNSKVKTFRCDNGGEYTSNRFKKYCEDKGINLDYTVPYTPQYNGKAERLNRTIMERTRSLLFEFNLPKILWSEAVLTAAYLTNRCSNTVTAKTPAELWFNRIPNLKHLKIFGSLAYYKINTNLGKLDSRSNKGFLVGYTNNGYKIWDAVNYKIHYSRDVSFIDNFDEIQKYLNESKRFSGQNDLSNLCKELELEDINIDNNFENNLGNSYTFERGSINMEERTNGLIVEETHEEEEEENFEDSRGEEFLDEDNFEDSREEELLNEVNNNNSVVVEDNNENIRSEEVLVEGGDNFEDAEEEVAVVDVDNVELNVEQVSRRIVPERDKTFAYEIERL